ncbi:MAG: hypothetical protein IPM07_13930 [Anaerolineales bacterium]|nr:hypothetical protein [Anaerolineales bacterium]
MLAHPRLVKLVSFVMIVSLMLSSAAPVALAQEGSGGSIYLPVIAGGAATETIPPSPTDINLFRTRVTVSTPAQWHDLARTGALVLERGDDWALVLADDAQLTDLARWHFMPQATNSLGALVNVVRAAGADGTLAASFGPLLAQIEAADGVMATDAGATATAHSALRGAVSQLTAAQIGWLALAASVDTDGDGLTDDQEGFWCTDSTKADSDFDGTSDGAEVMALKRWMNNELSKAPSTGKPFQGWPPQKSNCFDDDQDSVPDIAEALEVGLNANRESTDRDKFDDGQELFGNTYCPGTSGYCSYGALPRNEDWGVIFAEMPAWVKAPGHHPLVAGFPVPEVDVVASSFRVELVTTVTTANGTMTEQTQSYSTAKTEGTSTSVADTKTWNNWVEVSDSTTSIGAQSSAEVYASATEWSLDQTGKLTMGALTFVGSAATAIAGCGIGTAASVFTAGAATPLGVALCAGSIGGAMAGAYQSGEFIRDAFWPDNGQVQTNTNQYSPTQQRLQSRTEQQESQAENNNVVQSQSYAPNTSAKTYVGTQLTYQQNELISQSLYGIQNALTAPRFTHSESNGHSWGGSQTTTHETYEEHTVTNGEAFTTGENWSTATAVNSAHAANLWFDYKVRNTGTEYAHEICNLTFNIYIGDDPNPAYTYFVPTDRSGACFTSFDPGEEHTFSARTNTHAVPLSLEQLRTIDLGGPIRIVVEDFTYGIDERFYQDAVSSGVLIAIEDGTDDGDESIDAYLIPTWGSETVLNVLGRYFPHETDLNGMMTAIWTPEHRSTTPAWCQAPAAPTDQPSKAMWCKHTLSTADWWNVYTDGLGEGSEGFQNTPAAPGATALFRFNQNSDLDGFSDRSEARLGTDAHDASSFPRPEVLAGVHSIVAGSKVTITLSLLNTGLYDAYGVEAVMVAPDDSITIDNNTVGGSGRVKALKQVIVGSRISLPSPLPAPWTQANHAVPAPGGYYTGSADRTYTFTVNCGAGGCAVGEGSWTLAWNDGKGASGSLNFGAGYASPTFQPLGALGLTLALYTGSVQHGESFTVAATTPRDTFQYTINRTPHTLPLVIVSYNDPQGNHRFVVPSQAMSLTAPTDNLQPFAGQMLQEVGVEIVTQQAAAPGANSVQLLVNNPSDATLQDTRLFLEFINISGTVVSEVPTQVTLAPGPTYTPVSFNTGSFSPAFDASQETIVMAFLTDYQGNILDTAGRPLSSFQADPLPSVAVDAATLTWNFGTVAQGALLKHRPALANVGYGRLYTYLTPTPGLSLAARADVVGAADMSDYELILRTADLPAGAYDRTATLKTSDPTQPALTVRVQGTVTAAAGDTAGGLQRPLDVPVTVTGPKNQGEWVDFTHTLGPDAQSLHPVKVYPQDYSTLYGVGKYATDFSAGTASYDMFGDGRDGVMPGSGNLDNNNGAGIAIVNSGAAGATSISVTDAYGGGRINPGDAVLIHQTQGTGAGCWEMNKAVSDYAGGTATIQLEKPLQCTYASSGNNHAQVLRVPQYSTCNVTGTVTPLYAWNGSTGGIIAVMCSETMTVAGSIRADGSGFLGGSMISPPAGPCGFAGHQGEGIASGRNARSTSANVNGGGGGWECSNNGGAGGGHASAGLSGQRGTSQGGVAVGEPTMSSAMLFGGAGGSGAPGNTGMEYGGYGGNGGGIVCIGAKTITINGVITAQGTDGQGGTYNNREVFGGGGGAGGSIKIQTSTATLGSNRLLVAAGAGEVREWQEVPAAWVAYALNSANRSPVPRTRPSATKNSVATSLNRLHSR